MILAKKIAKNTLYLAVGKMISTAIGILTISILLRYLSTDDYGRYSTVLAFILLFGTFVDLGLNLTTTQDISLPGANVEKIISSVFSLRILINITLIMLLPAILLAFPYENEVKIAIMVCSVLFFSQSIFQVLSSYFQKTLQAWKIVLSELAGRIVLLFSTIVAVWFNFSFLEIMLTIILSSIAQLWAIIKFTSRQINLKISIDISMWKRITSKTWPIALSVIFTTIYFKGDTVILSLTRPYSEVGTYSAAYKILEVLITLPIMFMGLVLPYLSKSFAESDKKTFNEIIQKSWDAVSIITLPIAAGSIMLSNKIIFLIAGPGYEDSSKVLQILIIATGIIFLGSIFTHAVVAVNEQKQMIKYYATAAVAAVALYIIYIPIYSYYAAATVTVVSELLIATAAFLKVKRKITFQLSFKTFFKSLFCSITMATVLLVMDDFSIFVSAPTGAAFYALSIIVTKTHKHASYNIIG